MAPRTVSLGLPTHPCVKAKEIKGSYSYSYANSNSSAVHRGTISPAPPATAWRLHKAWGGETEFHELDA
ncbi:hypothetical protein Q31a_56950 [Aureliella helgolandensis]|uniref:Uncharacterized protein n=1 Tax=Aureliella helgolandensis TaxID=2527968 RepID=A0A518GFG5_9BACT|nr:hypothetical protein Q31a_56950 [Aureliella helgolandensis]